MNYDKMNVLGTRLGNYDAGMVLDVAVGRGEFLQFILQSFRTWKGAAGIDINPDSLKIAREKLGDLPVTLVVGSALDMPFPDHAFDTLTISNSLHHMEDLKGLLNEIKRVCRESGLVVINEMVNDQVTSMRENHMLYHNLIAEIDNQLGHYHRRIFSKEELEAIIYESDFEIVDHFIHEEKADKNTSREDVDQLVSSLNRRMEMLRNSEHYYFYENKISEITGRLREKGFHKPKQLVFFLKPG